MPKWYEYLTPIGMGNKAFPKLDKAVSNFAFGTPEEHERVSNLRPEQEPLYQQAVNAGLQKGAGGAFGEAADYYRNNLSDNPSDFNAFAAPQLRQYNQDIVPGISEQFAGMGSGGLSSSGFRNAQVQGATDLSERLGALRANLRHSSAQGLQGIGQQGLQNYSQDVVTNQGTQGFVSQAMPLVGNVLSQFTGNWLSNKYGGGNQVGTNSGPYGSQGPQASPNIQTSSRGSIPNYTPPRGY